MKSEKESIPHPAAEPLDSSSSPDEHKQAEERLRENEKRLQNQLNYLNTLIENMNEVFFTYDLDGRMTFINQKSLDSIGYAPAEMVGRPLLEFIHPDYREEVSREIQNRLTLGLPRSYETMALHKNGGAICIKLNSSPIIENGKIVGGMVLAEDITARRQAENALKESEQRLANIVNSLPDPTFVINLERQVIAWNRAMEEMTGVKAEKMLGRSDYENAIPFYHDRRPVLADLIIDPQQEKPYPDLREENGALVLEGECLVADNNGGQQTVYLWVKATPLYSSQEKIIGAIETFRDITERQQMEERLKYLSLHDPLTGLYNRAYFEQEMRRLDCGRQDPVGLIVCDVDGLKQFNDSQGHEAGDALLLAAAQVLRKCFREDDIVARIGGDEFAVLLPKSTQSTMEQVHRRVQEAIAEYNRSHPELPLSISLGFAVSNLLTSPMAELFRTADNQMYQQKLKRQGSPNP